MKKYLSLILSLILSVLVIPVSAFEVNASYSGNCGENAVWVYDDSTRTLTISGKGDMTDYNAYLTFDSNYNKIKSVVITEGVTSIGSNVFGICEYVTSISIPVSITKINKNAFENCSSLKKVYYAGTEAQWEKVSISTIGNTSLINAEIEYKQDEHTCSFGEWKIIYEPTCVGEGSKIRVCSCGNEEITTIPPTGVHSFGDWNTTVVETENQDGTETRVCSVCKFTETRIVDNIQSTDKNIIGDVNEDGNITAVDARIILQIVAGLGSEDSVNSEIADVNMDDKITAVDARFILQIVAGLK